MGLDMFAFARTKRPDKPVDFEFDEDDAEKLFYWRKHPNLHGWMEELYRAKGGGGVNGMDGPNTFNCVPVVIDSEDLDRLERAVHDNALPETAGFFFGASRPDDKVNDLKFIAKARAAIAAGKTVYYTSWW